MQLFKVGDKVRVRQWDDMAEEYGIVKRMSYDVVNTPLGFIEFLKPICGKTGTIAEVKTIRPDMQFVELIWDEEMGVFATCHFDSGMFELITKG